MVEKDSEIFLDVSGDVHHAGTHPHLHVPI